MANNPLEILYTKTNKGKASVDGMRSAFADKLANLLSDPDAPKGLGIYSGYRSPDRQAEIIRDHAGKYGLDGDAWMADVSAMGPIAAGKKWAGQFKASGMSRSIGKPGGSNHQHGTAADLGYNGISLKDAPSEVVDWVHKNADRYGLKFPLANENWHIEDSSTRGGAPSSSEQALASGGFNSSDQPYQPQTNAASSDWKADAAPDSTFQQPSASFAPSWSQVGRAVVNSTPTGQFAKWSDNATTQPDQGWLNNPDIGKFGKSLDGLNDDQRDYVLRNALNPSHVEVLRSQLAVKAEDAKAFGSSYSALPLSFVANVLDPISLAAGGVLGKGVVIGSNVLRAASTASVGVRMAEGGLVALGDTAIASGIQSKVDPEFDAGDFAFNSLVGAAIGAGAGMLGRAAHLSDVTSEASAYFGTQARKILADGLEKKGYELSPKAQAFLRPAEGGGSVGAAENLANEAAKFPDRRGTLEKIGDAVSTVSSNDALLRTKAGERVATMYKALAPDLSGTGGREMRAEESAYELMHRSTHTEVGNAEAAFQQNLDLFAAESGQTKPSWWKRDQLEDEFSRRIEIAMEDPATARGSKAVEAMAEHYRQGFSAKLKEAKAAGVEWAQDIPEDDFYVPFNVDKHQYYKVVSKIGRTGLIDVVRQSFLRAQPALSRVEKEVTKAQRIAYNKAIAAGEQVAEPKPKALKKGTKAYAAEAARRDKKVRKMAEHYVSMIEQTKVDNNTASRMMGLAGESERALRGMLEDMKMGKDEIDDFLSEFGYTQKAGPTNFRRRATLERNQAFVPEEFKGHPKEADYAVSLRDLTARDIRETFERYSRSVNGQLALYKKGFKSEADARAQIAEATNFRTAVEFDAEGKQNVFEGDLKTAATELNYMVDKILGKPAHPGVGQKTRLAINLLKSVSFIRFMQWSGMAQLGDAPKIALRYGVSATWNQRRMKDIVDVFHHAEDGGNAFSREIQSSTGVGIKTTNGRLYATHEDINLENELFDASMSDKLLARANAYAETGARVTAQVSMINPITDMLQLWAARSSSQRIIDIATGRARAGDGIIGRVKGLFSEEARAAHDQKWLNEMGLTGSDLKDFQEIAKHMTLDEDGKILRWNSEKQRGVSRDHADAYDRFLGVIRREVNQTILETSPNALRKWMSHPTASLFMQLKSYMLNSLQVNTVRNIKLGPAYMAQSLIATSVWGTGVYVAQTYAQSIGRPDREEFLKKRLDLRSLLTTGFARSPDASIFPMVWDTAMQGVGTVTGTDMRSFSQSRTSGLGSSIGDSIPAVKTVGDFASLVGNSVAALTRSDQHFDQKEWGQLRDFIPLMRTYGMLNATNAIIGTAPEDKDPPLIKGNIWNSK